MPGGSDVSDRRNTGLCDRGIKRLKYPANGFTYVSDRCGQIMRPFFLFQLFIEYQSVQWRSLRHTKFPIIFDAMMLNINMTPRQIATYSTVALNVYRPTKNRSC